MMKRIYLAIGLFFLPNLALASGLGRRKFEIHETVEPYFYFCIALVVISSVFVLITKPKGVPFQKLHDMRLTGLVRVYFRIAQWAVGACALAIWVSIGFTLHDGKMERREQTAQVPKFSLSSSDSHARFVSAPTKN